MKTISSALRTHLSGEYTTVALLWKVKRQDGTILGFTQHDQDISYNYGDGDGVVVFSASTGFTPSARESGSDLSTDNLQVTAFLHSDAVTEGDLRARKYDFASIDIRLVNWADLTMGDMKLRKGTLGQVKIAGGMFTVEIRGLSYTFGIVIGETFGPSCRADLGDARCTVNLAPLSQNGTVAMVVDRREFTPAGGLSPAGDGYFADGVLTWTSGANNGALMEVAEWDGTRFILFESMAFAIAPGDTFAVEPGCRHTPQDCFGKFNNIVNFQGENQLPGINAIMLYPDATTG